jgi:hypothetical protein
VCPRVKICGISYDTLLAMIAERKRLKGADEATYTVLVTVSKGKRFRAYMSPPGKKKEKICEQVVPRDGFPEIVFT